LKCGKRLVLANAASDCVELATAEGLDEVAAAPGLVAVAPGKPLLWQRVDAPSGAARTSAPKSARESLAGSRSSVWLGFRPDTCDE